MAYSKKDSFYRESKNVLALVQIYEIVDSFEQDSNTIVEIADVLKSWFASGQSTWNNNREQ